ncbi:MAG: membrane protein insertase YidC [Stappiaceae bacterium]
MVDNKNYIIAIVLSLAILLGWQFFVAAPQIERQRQEAELAQKLSSESNIPAPAPGTAESSTPQSGQSQSVAGGSPSQSTMSREQALQQDTRITIDTPRLSGSISLTGARIDDIRLRDYHETVDPESPTIVLFSPEGTENSYYGQYGWSNKDGQSAKVPDPTTVWTQNGSGPLTPDQPLELSWNNGEGLVFYKRISIDENYMLQISQSVENKGSDAVALSPYALLVRKGEPETAGFFILHEGLIGVIGEEGLQEIDYSDLAEAEQGTIPLGKSEQGWFGITDKYWAATLIPANGVSFTPRYFFVNSPSSDANDLYQADYIVDPILVEPGKTSSYESHLFAGAKINSLIEGYSETLSIKQFDLLIDWGWFHFITKPMFYMIDWFYNLVGNFGVAILLSTVVIKIIFFPLANKSYVSMSRMKLVQPQMTELREQYKDDRAAQQKALMELYKKEKINPLAGCLPMLIQIPVFFSLYKVLFVTIEMRHAPFFGWIKDLSAPDPTSMFNLFGLIPWEPPLFLLIGVWPLIMGVTMFVQMKMNPTPTEPAQQMIFNWMPVIFTFMLATFPAGLVIYWAWNNALSILQQYVIMRRQGVKIELWDNIKSMIKPKPKGEAN